MVRHRAHGRNGRTFLPTPHGGGADEDASVFAPVGAAGPLRPCVVPEGFPLGGEVAVAGGDAEEEGVIFFEGAGVDGRDRRVFGGGVHFAEDFFGEGLGDSVGGRGGWLACVVADGAWFVCVVDASTMDGGARWGEGAHWKRSAVPPAASMPAFSASASLWMWPYMEY